jgi:cytochrome c-type biogenesis protein CcmE
MVVPGSVEWDAEAINLTFRMKDTGEETIEVHSNKAPPQMFRENMGVVVEGKLTRAGVFEASTLMVKHSNEYSAPQEGEDLHEKYRSLMTESGS